MSRDKQMEIEQMAKDLENHTCMSEFQAEIASKMLYIKGDRKASEVAREIFEEIEKIAMHNVTSSHGIWLLSMGEVAFAELKKKYTEDGNENNVNANGL